MCMKELRIAGVVVLIAVSLGAGHLHDESPPRPAVVVEKVCRYVSGSVQEGRISFVHR